MKITYHSVFVLSCIGIFIALSIGSAMRESVTYDEIVYVEEGRNALISHTFAIDPYNPPLIKEITALPIVLGMDRLIDSPRLSDRWFPGRLTAISLGVLLLLSVYFVTKRFFGTHWARLSLFLMAFEPNILGNSHYITLDVGVALFLFLAYVSFLWLLERPSRSNFLFSGTLMGLALASKISALTYLLVSCVLAIAVDKRSHAVGWLCRHARYLTMFIVVAALVLWSTYFFQTAVIIADRDDPTRVSRKIVASADARGFTAVGWLVEAMEQRKIPLGNYLSTLKNTIIRSQQPAKTYFFGKEYSQSRWYFLWGNVLLKTPLPLLIFFALSVASIVKYGTKKRVVLLGLIPVVSIVFVSSVARIPPMVRYVLPIYAFAIPLVPLGARVLSPQRYRVLWIVLCLWYAGSTISAFPHFLSYANELAGDRQNRYAVLTDSNLDWGQSLPDISAYVARRKPQHLSFSYFGRDNAAAYGLTSNRRWGSHRFEDICAFHEISLPYVGGGRVVAISVSNWYNCGYYQQKEFAKERVADVVGDTFLLFNPY